jgi:hypothetical protein
MILASYTSTSWQWISAGDVLFSHRNLITLRTSMFDYVSASPTILQLMLGQYDWYEAQSSVCERKQCSTCSDLAGNLNEIRNITHMRGLVTLFIESPSYISHLQDCQKAGSHSFITFLQWINHDCIFLAQNWGIKFFNASPHFHNRRRLQNFVALW